MNKASPSCIKAYDVACKALPGVSVLAYDRNYQEVIVELQWPKDPLGHTNFAAIRLSHQEHFHEELDLAGLFRSQFDTLIGKTQRPDMRDSVSVLSRETFKQWEKLIDE